MTNLKKNKFYKFTDKVRSSKKSEPEFCHASKSKNLDNMKLLVSHPEVKEIITETRKQIRVPEERLKEEKIKYWHQRNDLKCDKIMNSSDFIKQEENIKEKLKKDEINSAQAKELMDDLYLQVPVNYLYSQIWKIIRGFNVPDNYEHHIYEYILYGNITAPTANYSIGPFKPGEKIKNVRRVPITVYAKLTDKDLRDLKLQVNRYFGNKRLTLIQDTKNIDRDLESERLLKEKEYDYATGTENKLSKEDVAERVFGSRKKKKDVSKALERINKLRKNRFGKS